MEEILIVGDCEFVVALAAVTVIFIGRIFLKYVTLEDYDLLKYMKYVPDATSDRRKSCVLFVSV